MSLDRFEAKKSKPQFSARSYNTYQNKHSSYDRVFSTKLIITSMIPNFLVPASSNGGLTSIDLLRLNPWKSEPEQISSRDLKKSSHRLNGSVLGSCQKRIKANPDRQDCIKSIEAVIRNIFNQALPPSEIILKFNNRTLTRADLTCFIEGSNLPSQVVDLYMSVLKSKCILHLFNRKCEKTIILNTSYSNNLFKNKSQPLKLSQNIFENKFLMAPIFDGYWTLLVVNLQSGVTHFYDGLMPDRDIQSILILLRRFLARANFGDVNRVGEGFVKFERNELPCQSISLKDSGVFICKVAECIIQNREIKEFDFRDCRKEILDNLIRVYLKLL